MHFLGSFSTASVPAPLAANCRRAWHAPFLGTAALFFALCGCAQISSSSYTISGTIMPSSDGSGATLTLSGAAAATTTANSSGNYSFTGVANGTYVVTPSRSGYTFSPTQQAVMVNGASASGINFTGSQGYSVALSWVASTSSVAGYNIYRATTSGGPYSKINSSLITGLSYADTSVASGNTYFYVATSVDSAGVESVTSNQATAQIP